MHPWMWRFAFPGFAETVWVLPAGVAHEASEYEPMPWPFPHGDILDWADRRECHATLLELYRATTGHDLRVDPARPLRCQVDDLREAFSQQRLVAWRLRVSTFAAPAVLPDAPVIPSAPKPSPTETPTWALTSFSYVAVIAPGAEDPKPLLQWTYSDPDSQVVEGHIEVYRGDDSEHKDRLGVINLNLTRLAELSLPWDGHVGGAFTQGYVTCENPEYRLRMVLEGRPGDPQFAECTFRVEVVDIVLSVGPRNLLTLPRHLEVYDLVFSSGEPAADPDAILPLPKPDATGVVRVPLRSNLFWRGRLSTEEGPSNEEAFASRESFEQYQMLWGDGPVLPLITGVYFRNSTGGRTLAPKAWGRRRVLWTWGGLPEDMGELSALPRAYVQGARAYKADEPPTLGEKLCHADFGGKRSPTGRPPMFESTTNDPFRLREAAGLVGAVWSEAVQDGELSGYAGVMFRPPRQSGETLRVTACFQTLLVEGLEAPGVLDLGSIKYKAPTPAFQTWRAVYVVRQLIKNPEIIPTSVLGVAPYYAGAFLDLQDRIVEAEVIGRAISKERADAGGYNRAIRDQIRQIKNPVGTNPRYKDFLASHNMFAEEADHETALEAVVIRTPEEMFRRFRRYLIARHDPADLAPLLYNGRVRTEDEIIDWDFQLAKALWDDYDDKDSNGEAKGFGNNRYFDPAIDLARAIVRDAMIWLFPEYDVPVPEDDAPDHDAPGRGSRPADPPPPQQRPIPNGITSFEFHTLLGHDIGHLLGDTPNTARRGATLFIYHEVRNQAEMERGKPPLNVLLTYAHESGHALFLPHRNPGGESNPEPRAHDRADELCLMGYEHGSVAHGLETVYPDHFCGLCLLRLRGWDHQAVEGFLQPKPEP